MAVHPLIKCTDIHTQSWWEEVRIPSVWAAAHNKTTLVLPESLISQRKRCEKQEKKEKQASLTPFSYPLTVLWAAVITFCISAYSIQLLSETPVERKLFLFSLLAKIKILQLRMIRLRRGRKGWAKGEERRERERNTLINFSWLRVAVGQKREGERWMGEMEGGFFPLSAGNLALFFLGVLACWLNFTRKARQRVFFFFQLIPSCSFKVLLLVLNWSSQLSTEFKPRLLTTCDAMAITDQPTERRGAHLYKWPGAKNWLTCVCHVKCTVYAT